MVRFGEFRVDENAFEMWLGSTRVEIEPQVFDLLVFLINNRDRIVSRDELFDNVWKGRVVSDATLSSRIRTLRRILGDDGATQKFIRTIHGRGFRFVAAVEEPPGNARPMRVRENAPWPVTTRYAKSGSIHVAYQLFGEGPVNLVIAPGFVSHIENYWSEPALARWLTRLGEFARVVMFDKRGTGLSDQVPQLPGMDERMDDVRAVMDAAGFDRAVLMGISEGGSLASLFTASHPERSIALVLYGAFAKFTSWFRDEGSLQGLFEYIDSAWGSGESLPAFAPGMAEDPDFKAWWGRFERLGASPGAAIALMRMNSEIDISDIVPSIRVPSLIIHRTDDILIDVAGGRYLAESIPGAKFVELEGRDHLPWVGENAYEILDAVEEFVARAPAAPRASSFLATVLCVNFGRSGVDPAVGGDANLARERSRRIRDHLLGFGGKEIFQGDGEFLASFSGPARAIYCAHELASEFERHESVAAFGIHTGEIELTDSGARGFAVDLARRVAGLSGAGEILVSRTVKDLVAGSGISFDARERIDVGDTEDWCLYSASL